MQLHQLTQIKFKKKKRIGRGGKRGTYSGRGIKGQKARAGARIRPAIRDFIRKIHKLRGVPAARYKKQSTSAFETWQIVNLDEIDGKYSDGETVSVNTLLEKGIIRRVARKVPNVKILGKGELSKKLKFEGVTMSKSAEAKINTK